MQSPTTAMIKTEEDSLQTTNQPKSAACTLWTPSVTCSPVMYTLMQHVGHVGPCGARNLAHCAGWVCCGLPGCGYSPGLWAWAACPGLRGNPIFLRTILWPSGCGGLVAPPRSRVRLLEGANFQVGIKKIVSPVTTPKHKSKARPRSWLFSQCYSVTV
jgi:hypothetical protein